VDSTLRRWFCHGLTAGLVVSAVCIGTPAVYAQEKPTLADLARQEAERRKAIKTPAKVITNKDVKSAPLPPVQAGAGPGAAPAAPTPQDVPAAAAAEEPKGEAHDQAWWKARMDQLRDALPHSEMFAESLQTRINALTNDYVNRDDPYQRAKIGEDRQKALAELDRVKSDIERTKKAITDLEEEARQAGVPPGWLR
jgi:hypothetical protein